MYEPCVTRIAGLEALVFLDIDEDANGAIMPCDENGGFARVVDIAPGTGFEFCGCNAGHGSSPIGILADIGEIAKTRKSVQRHEAWAGAKLVLFWTVRLLHLLGEYMSPPNRAIVLCVNEKSQFQALDREQPVLPMAPCVPERRTHTLSARGHFKVCHIISGCVIKL